MFRALGLMAIMGVACKILPAQTVKTAEGAVQGSTENGIARFLGVPYAAAPVGALRWRPPQRHAPWTGVRPATAYGPSCAQITTLGVFAGPANNHEDCLYLNVFSPHVSTAAKLPVIVYIHGGGDFTGESNDYDGGTLAAAGTVVVTFNYRLGMFGWLAHPALDTEGHPFANYGLLDQQFVLHWVQRNIGAFGGDPTRVTLGGQSAGSEDTEANVASPLAKGLFHRAIFQSIVEEPIPLAPAESLGTAFAKAAGCSSAQCLRHLSADQILALSGTQSEVGPYMTGPVADGRIIPSDGFISAFKRGIFNHVPVMSGTTSDEANFLVAIREYFSGPPRVPATEADFRAYVTSTWSETADQILTHYPLNAYPSPQLAIDATRTDFYACTQREVNRVLASQVPVYAYEFQDRTAPSYFPDMPGFQPLAYHTADIQYLFHNWHGGPLGVPHALDSAQAELSGRLVHLWANFARTGNPNGEGDSPWPRYPSYLSENIPELSTLTDAQFHAAHHCDFWDPILVP